MLTDRPSYQALKAHYRQIRGRHLRDLFAEDAGRGKRIHAEAAGLYLDYSKNRITAETLRLLLPWPKTAGCARASRPCSAATMRAASWEVRRSRLPGHGSANCKDWLPAVDCQPGEIATAADIHYGPGAEPRSWIGIALQCRAVKVTEFRKP